MFNFYNFFLIYYYIKLHFFQVLIWKSSSNAFIAFYLFRSAFLVFLFILGVLCKIWSRSNFLRPFFRPKFAFHLRIKSFRPSMHQNSPARDRLISDSRRALQFRGDSRPHSFLIIRGDIIDRHCTILLCSYRIKSSPRRAIVAIRKVHPLFFPRPTSMVNLESAVQFCRAKHLPSLQIYFCLPEDARGEQISVLWKFY